MNQQTYAREAKFRYGEILRQQMKYDEEKKKLQKIESLNTPKLENLIGYNNPAANRSMITANIYNAAPVPSMDKKQLLQKKMQAGDAFPFGRKQRNFLEQKSSIHDASLQFNMPTYQVPQSISPSSVMIPTNYQSVPLQSSHEHQYYQQSNRPNYHLSTQNYPGNKQSLPIYDTSLSPPKDGNNKQQPFSSGVIPYPISDHDDSPNKKRNLLKYQNIPQTQLVNKHLQKQQLQRQLKEQMEMVARKKEQQRLKAIMEDQRLEQQNRRYIQQINERENLMINQRKRKQMMQKQQEEEQKRMLQKAHEQAVAAKKRVHSKPNVQGGRLQTTVSVVQDKQDYVSIAPPKRMVVRAEPKSYPTSIEDQSRSFNGYIQQNRAYENMIHELQQKHKVNRRHQQKYFQMIKKDVENIRGQILSQSQMYKIEMQKIKMEAEKARMQKNQKQYEFLRLKDEFQKNKSNENLKYALHKTDRYYQEQMQKKNSFLKKQKDYSITSIPKRSVTQPTYDDGIRSLAGDSIKISYKQKPHQIKYNNVYEEQQQEYQRNYQSQYIERDHDSLDKFIRHQKQKGERWNTLSSVDSEITDQIQRLLKEQRSPIEVQDERYYGGTSNISSLGKLSLNRQLYGDLSYGQGSVDVGKINKHNERRLDRLKQIGVREDQELGRLDNLLSNY